MQYKYRVDGVWRTCVKETRVSSNEVSQARSWFRVADTSWMHGTYLGSTTIKAYSPTCRGGRQLHRPRISVVFKSQGESGVWEGREGCSEQSAQVAIWTDVCGNDNVFPVTRLRNTIYRAKLCGQGVSTPFVPVVQQQVHQIHVV
eukprot:1159069-Pelagomonas_calceolata.AAC.7